MPVLNYEPSKARPLLIASPLLWLLAGVPGIFALLAFICSWPLGPGYVDEGGVTKLRLAVALIALTLLMAISVLTALMHLMLQALRRLEDVAARLPAMIDQQK